MLKKVITSVTLCAAVMTSAGCKTVQKDNYVTGDYLQPIIAENITMETEFSEYDGNTEVIRATVVNNSDKEFGYGAHFFLQKLDGEEWRFIVVQGLFQAWAGAVPPSEDCIVHFEIKDHVKLPLLPGTYRIGLGLNEGEKRRWRNLP